MEAKLDLRLRQLYAAIGEVRSRDFSSIQPQRGAANGRFYCQLEFSGGATDADLANTVSLFIASIACLKDHLKAWCAAHNQPFHGDRLINSNRDVAVIHDLWNRDKHFELDRSRSGLFPEIRDICRAMRFHGGAGMSFDVNKGDLKIVGKTELVIDADVVDASGARIGSLIKIAERAIREWESAFAAAGVVLPSRPVAP